VTVARLAVSALSLALILSLAGPVVAAPASHSGGHGATGRAPTGPPLSPVAPQADGESTAGIPSGAGDPLVENGLSSPLCKGSTAPGLSSAAHSNCQTSDFVGAPAPTGNYALDVNIDVGPFGLSKGGLLSVIQDVFVTPLWNALVWIAHALIVMLEWCYTLELVGGSTMSGIAESLRQAQASFTEPWLPLALAAASTLATYNGLVRRRVAETLGQALVTIAMMAIGLWVIADPLGTVGAVGQWANQASLGTLGAVAEGTPANAPRTLADGMRSLFAGAIEMPWCYLEFGNVRWCSEPTLLDQSLRSAALRLVATQGQQLACRSTLQRSACSSTGSAAAHAVEQADELLREADTNGRLFLAFPANRPERNSVKEGRSLLHVLCQADDDTKCTGPTAAQAEFRSDSGTFPRMIGVALIAIGVLGMAMLFGLIALHLLAAALMSLFMLLLAPVAVLAPALGDGGRAVFGGWLARLLGAVTSKLIFSFLLGALLTMQRMLMSLQPLGWWTQWLLVSAFWWAVFVKRRQAQTLLRSWGRQPAAGERRPIGRRIEGALQAQRVVRRPVQWARSKILSPVSATEQLSRRGEGPGDAESPRTGGGHDGEREARGGPGVILPGALRRRRSSARSLAAPVQSARGLALRAQLARVRDARAAALAIGDRRHAVRLAVREGRIERELASERQSERERQSEHPQSSVSAGGGSAPRIGHSPLAQPRVAGAGTTSESTPLPRQGGQGRDPRAPVVERASAKRNPAPGPSPTLPVSDPRGGGVGHARERRSTSTVMDDARAVAEGRKRQLGYEVPE
jgi:hypothetical protein